MFSTQLGSVSEDANTIYLRPETAQGIFVNFLNVQKTGQNENSLWHCPNRKGIPE